MKSKEGKTFGYISGKKYDGMMGRCYREKDPSYGNYGGRGIAVCSAWIKDINSFRVWLIGEIELKGIGIKHFIENSDKYQLDRIDVNGHYSPQNCRLATCQQNARNKRSRIKRQIKSAEGEMIEISGGVQ